MLSRLRDESSDLREQLGKAQDKCDVACQTARDFREYNIRLQQQLREVEAHLAMVLDARELEKDSHAAEQELVQQEQEQKHNELIKQVKLLQKKTSQARSAETPTHAETMRVVAYAEASTCVEQVHWRDSYAQADSDAVLFPSRIAAQKLHEDIRKAEDAFRDATAQGNDRWADAQ